MEQKQDHNKFSHRWYITLLALFWVFSVISIFFVVSGSPIYAFFSAKTEGSTTVTASTMESK